MSPALVVRDPPSFDLLLGLGNRLEPVNIQALVGKQSVEAFDELVVSGLARPTEVDLHVMVVGP